MPTWRESFWLRFAQVKIQMRLLRATAVLPSCQTEDELTHSMFPFLCLAAGNNKHWDLWLQALLHYGFTWDRSRKSSDAASCRTAHSFKPLHSVIWYVTSFAVTRRLWTSRNRNESIMFVCSQILLHFIQWIFQFRHVRIDTFTWNHCLGFCKVKKETFQHVWKLSEKYYKLLVHFFVCLFCFVIFLLLQVSKFDRLRTAWTLQGCSVLW